MTKREALNKLFSLTFVAGIIKKHEDRQATLLELIEELELSDEYAAYSESISCWSKR